jgi:hypothetical protein
VTPHPSVSVSPDPRSSPSPTGDNGKNGNHGSGNQGGKGGISTGVTIAIIIGATVLAFAIVAAAFVLRRARGTGGDESSDDEEGDARYGSTASSFNYQSFPAEPAQSAQQRGGGRGARPVVYPFGANPARD